MNEPTVFIVDDDQAVARSLRWLIESVQLKVEIFPSAQAFLDGYNAAKPGCLVLDVRMPGMSGIELQERLTAQRIRVPIIFITGHGDVQVAVRAVQAGAFDFIEKPFNDQDLLDRMQRAISFDAERRGRDAQSARLSALFASLTPREREVLRLLADIRDRLQLSMLFITHDLRVAAQVCDTIAVMRNGEVVEHGPTAQVFADPRHPYTRELLESVPGRGWTGARAAAPADR